MDRELSLSHSPLLGKWQSDKDLTLASMREIGGLSQEAVQIFEPDFFGQLVLEYREATFRAMLPNEEYDTGYLPYRVVEVDADKNRIVVETMNGVGQKPSRSEWFVDGTRIYTLTGRTNFREYFRRIT